MMDTRWAYLFHLLAWTLPVIAFQLLLLARHYRARTGAVLQAVLVPALAVGAYLSAADHLAIRKGLWRFGAGKHLGLLVGSVPLEEIIFFFITSILVGVGLALFTALLQPRVPAP